MPVNNSIGPCAAHSGHKFSGQSQRLDAAVMEHDGRGPLGGPAERHRTVAAEGHALSDNAGSGDAGHVLVAVQLEAPHFSLPPEGEGTARAAMTSGSNR